MGSRPGCFEASQVSTSYHERSDEIRRPVPRRMSGLSMQRGNGADNNNSGLAKAGNSSHPPAAPEQRLSAWTTYHNSNAGTSPVHEPVVPPPDTEATLATQAAAQQLWENHTAAESDQTASTTPPPESPPHQAPQQQQAPPAIAQLNSLQAMLNGLGNLGALSNQQAMQLHEVYLKSLHAALTQAQAPPVRPEEAAPEGPREATEHKVSEHQPADNFLARPKAERASAANGSLSMLPPEAPQVSSGGLPEHSQSVPLPSARLPPQTPFQPSPQTAPQASQAPTLGPQQVVELLGEMLRAHTQGAGAPPKGSLPTEQPPLVMGNPSAPYPSFRYNSQEGSFREAPAFPAGMDAESLNKLASRRWNSCASLTSDSSMYSSGGGFGNHASLGHLPQNLTGAESQALLQALQQKYQASEMESMANMTIQAILAGSANREAHGGRKRKLPDIYEESKRHNSLLSEGETYPFVSGQQQVCTECGTTSTPTWRRSGKRLMCNACGLRRSRSMRSARSASIPLAAAAAASMLEHPVEEPAKMHMAM